MTGYKIGWPRVGLKKLIGGHGVFAPRLEQVVRLPLNSRTPLAGHYVMAVFCVFLAALARKQLDPILGDHYPSITFYFAVFISAGIGGWKPGMLALVLGALTAAFFFIAPRGVPKIASPMHLYGLIAYISVGGASVFFSETQWRTQRQMEAALNRLQTEIIGHHKAESKLAAFSRLGQRLSAVATPEDAGCIIAEVADELFGWDAFSLTLYSLENNIAEHILHVDTFDGKKIQIPPERLKNDIPLLTQRIMTFGAELVLKENPGVMSPELRPFGNKSRPSASLMFVPVRDKAKTIGVLSIQSYQPKAYNEHDLAMLQAFTDVCGGALQRIRAEEEILRLNVELEHRVLERTAQLERSNRELEAFSFAVSHDLRAPLRSISGFTQALKDEYNKEFDDAGRDYLRRVIQAGQQMDQLITDLLQLSRLSRGEINRQPVDLSALAEGIIADLREAEPERQVDFITTPGLTAAADVRLMRIALENLLRNAWKFTKNHPAARIEFGEKKMPGDGLTYFVRDNGAGFDMTYAGKLFGAFQRLHDAAEFPGHGIGLATVQRVIARHGGKTWAAGEVDRGAVFYFTLPA